MGDLVVEYVTIAANADLSSEIDLRSRVLRGVAFPSGWEGTGNVGYAVASDNAANATFYPVEDFGHASDDATVFPVDGGKLLARTKMIVGGSQTAARTVALLTEARD